MKRIVSLILVFAMCLPLCACGEKSNEIELTLDNYEQYIDFQVSPMAMLRNDYEGNSFVIGVASDGYSDAVCQDYSQNVYGYFLIKGLSQNFNYNNIAVKVELSGKCYHLDLNADKDDNTSTLAWSEYSFIAECNKVDITGNGKGEGKWTLPSGRGIPNFEYWNGVRKFYDPDDFLQYEYKVVSVSGTVTPA